MENKIDFLIVGGGISGILMAYQCHQNNKSFILVADDKKSATHVAAGVINPVVLSKFNPIWEAEQQMQELKEDFLSLEKFLEKKIIHSMPVYRIFSSEDEQKTWHKKSENNPTLQKFLSTEFHPNHYPSIDAPLGFGEVLSTGYVDFKLIIQEFFKAFKNFVKIENFDFDQFQPEIKKYKNFNFQHCVFCEGINVKRNPYFQSVPIKENKGEVLKIKTTANLPNAIVKSKCFLMPIGNQEYYVGATYAREFDDDEPTEEGKLKLENQLKSFFKKDYEIIAHYAAIRPTVQDRRPVVGKHHELNGIYILNGMGTRGTFNAPYSARRLINFILKGEKIPEEINYQRFI